MKKSFFKILRILFFAILVLAAFNYKLVCYGFSQLFGQMHILMNTRPVSEVIADTGTSAKVRNQLLFIDEVRRYAMDSLGLENSSNYTSFYDQHGKPVMWVVTGSMPYQLKAKEWWFPVVGNVSYKGFFDEQSALKEQELIREHGYETDIYSPSAWSTLGFFRDPVLSEMLNRGPGRLSELIIHELTHATVYLESSVDYNENLATFIGEKGAAAFLASKYGAADSVYIKYTGMLSDEVIYTNYMVRAAKKLDSLYRSFDITLSVYEKTYLKYKCIAGIMHGLNRQQFSNPRRYYFDFKKSRLPNNTEFLSFLRYRNKQDHFKKLYESKYNSDIRKFIAALKEDETIFLLNK
jgi:predicted aminopeptidase